MDKRYISPHHFFLVFCIAVSILLLFIVYKVEKHSDFFPKKKLSFPKNYLLPVTKSPQLPVVHTTEMNLNSKLGTLPPHINSNKRASVCPTDLKPGKYGMDPVNNKINQTKVVLYWNRPADWFLNFNHCEDDCIFTYDKCDFPRSDAVLFTASNLYLNHIPKRVPGQVYVYLGLEPPERYYTNYNDKKWHNVFNWTWSYRRDSDISAPYGKIVPNNKKYDPFENFSQIFNSKKKDAAILVSHCKTESKREKYVKLMQKYINVDVYGACGDLKCSRSNHGNCTRNLEKNYKYYLSFENSLCKDYTTEKALHITERMVIPVTRGDKYINMYLPPNSYINTADFTSVKNLTFYLRQVGSKEEEYKQFFNWKRHYKPEVDYLEQGLCKLCKKLHNVQNYQRSYKDIHAWFTRANNGNNSCFKIPNDLH